MTPFNKTINNIHRGENEIEGMNSIHVFGLPSCFINNNMYNRQHVEKINMYNVVFQ